MPSYVACVHLSLISVLSLACVFVFTERALAQQSRSIVMSKHNLSASGPGAIRASSEQEICIFCHTPHNSSPITPLWNRNMPVSAYTVYASPSLDALPGQPTGSSKLCLSCHDGSIAVGSVLSRGQTIAMSGGTTTLPPGHGNLGTDLSDDHPVSFRYDSALAARDPKLKNPTQLPVAVKLDRRGELQCTTCHDAHSDQYGKFMVMDNSASQLCNSCHNLSTTTVATHTDCNSCHTPHSAPSGAYLLKGADNSVTCLQCHSGQSGPGQGANVQVDLNKISRHDNPPPRLLLGEATTGFVTCTDCHESHSMRSQTAVAPAISPKLGNVPGVNTVGAAVPVAQFQYEVCFKCHDNTAVTASTITRQVVQNNTRLEFSPSAVSYHPVQAAGKNPDVPSLRPGLTSASFIYCTDCHASDSSKLAGGAGADGPHGSNNMPLLSARYDTMDNIAESPTAYALCYKCHDRTSILADQSFTGHKRHVVDQKTPCSVCHDSHGIASGQGNAINNAHLMNFDTTVVQPFNGKLEYRSMGPLHGTCTLSCHGKDHDNTAY